MTPADFTSDDVCAAVDYGQPHLLASDRGCAEGPSDL
jgi:hypothetical protein